MLNRSEGTNVGIGFPVRRSPWRLGSDAEATRGLHLKLQENPLSLGDEGPIRDVDVEGSSPRSIDLLGEHIRPKQRKRP